MRGDVVFPGYVGAASLFLFFILSVFQDSPGLADQGFAGGFQGRDSDRVRFSGFQDGEIRHRDADVLRQFSDAHFAFCQHDVYIDDYCHFSHLISYSRFLA